MNFIIVVLNCKEGMSKLLSLEWDKVVLTFETREALKRMEVNQR